MAEQRNVHDFEVTAVEPGDDPAAQEIALVLTDIRGGKVRLHLSAAMAARLRDEAAAALDRRAQD